MARPTKLVAVETSTIPLARQSLFERIAAYLDANDWNYTSNDEKNCFLANCRLTDASVRVVMEATEQEDWDRVLVYSIFPVFTPEHRRAALTDAINRINYSMAFGNLEMDANDGEVRVRTAVEGAGNLGDEMIDRALTSNLRTAESFQAALLAIAFGNASPDSVLALAERGTSSTLQ